jgi:hypothetical protein
MAALFDDENRRELRSHYKKHDSLFTSPVTHKHTDTHAQTRIRLRRMQRDRREEIAIRDDLHEIVETINVLSQSREEIVENRRTQQDHFGCRLRQAISTRTLQ